ncbi:MAG: 50S ribosome-binding GTPase [Acidimicrobiia bacterium]|nr:50S ribosome-binding GTPase [Acidimicrobiia bacterium]
MSDLSQLGDLLDVCLARSESVVNPDMWKELAALRGRLRRRTGFLGEILVVALAGGTGSGKSSLMNALCGVRVAEVGIERPTTSRCLAATPSDIVGDLSGFVVSLGIDEMIEVSGLDDLVLVDLPDFDSTFTDHRRIVETVLDVVDAVIWVFDPEKYSDRIIHDSFLKPLRGHQDQMLFVLNQADRLEGHLDQVKASLRVHLRDDGFIDPHVITTVATASESVDLSTDELESALAERLDIKETAIQGLAVDIAHAANRLWQHIDQSFDELQGDERHEAALAMASFVSLGVAANHVAALRPRKDTSDELG